MWDKRRVLLAATLHLSFGERLQMLREVECQKEMKGSWYSWTSLLPASGGLVSCATSWPMLPLPVLGIAGSANESRRRHTNLLGY